ncbi:hypothetical protein BY996DRAFT_6427084 [Phakopsora pachyrhizi]|nr:hypothetical protein BY996DRAFT_6427084 [Phakopsora pachyrhizi]
MLIRAFRLTLVIVRLLVVIIFIYQPGETRPMSNIVKDHSNFGRTSEESATIRALTRSFSDNAPTLDFLEPMPLKHELKEVGPCATNNNLKPLTREEKASNELYYLLANRHLAKSSAEKSFANRNIRKNAEILLDWRFETLRSEMKTKAFFDDLHGTIWAQNNTPNPGEMVFIPI